MRSDQTHRIGSVAAVESERVTVELDTGATGLVKAGSAGVLSIGVVNSYITIPSGSTRVVAVVTAITMVPVGPGRGQLETGGVEIARTLEASMVGRLEAGTFERGVTSYPSVFAPVSLATQSDLESIFRPGGHAFRFGEAVAASDQDVWLDADRLLSRHFAVIGTTGAGKSCSVMAILDGLLELGIRNSSIVIFDTNGEYAPCFAPGTARRQSVKAFTMGPEPGAGDALLLPQWFMNTEEHLELLRAAEGVQAPLLQRAIADARVTTAARGDVLRRLRVVRRTLENIERVEQDKKPQEKILRQVDSLRECLEEYVSIDDGLASTWQEMQECVSSNGGAMNLDPESWNPLDAVQQDCFQKLTTGLTALLKQAVNELGLGSAATTQDFDAPAHYSLEDLSEVFLPQRIDMEAQRDPKIGAFAVSMQMRLARLLADERYSFMTRVAPFTDALSSYLRLLFGKDPLGGTSGDSATPWEDAYKRGPSTEHSITILDLSLISQDVLSVVTALIARLILDLVQRIEPRARIPVLVVLEEAHRYVRRDSGGARSQSALIFERIAKEGRKYGVSLGLASQRPSELDPTVLSQCGSLIAHRIVGQADQEILRAATPLASRDVLRQLPGLATQHAILLGDAVSAPVAVRVREVPDPPDSRDPSFIETWRVDNNAEQAELIRETARSWEAGERRRIGGVKPTDGDGSTASEEPAGSAQQPA